MKESELLYKAAELCERNGFDPALLPYKKCGCFVHHLRVALYGRADFQSLIDTPKGFSLLEAITEVVQSTDEFDLERDGWTTPDAVAALRIAGDLAFCDEQAAAK